MNKNSESKKVKSLVLLGMMAMMSSAEHSGPVYTPGFDPKSDPDYCEIDYDAEEPAEQTYEEPVTPYEEPVHEPTGYKDDEPIIFDHPVIYEQPVVYKEGVTY